MDILLAPYDLIINIKSLFLCERVYRGVRWYDCQIEKVTQPWWRSGGRSAGWRLTGIFEVVYVHATIKVGGCTTDVEGGLRAVEEWRRW